MKKRIWFTGVVLSSAVFLAPRLAVSQENTGQEGQPDPAAMLEAYKNMSEPGEFHTHLKPLVGRWNQVTKYRMSPDQPWEESAGSAEYRWILDGRFLIQDIKGQMAEGYPFTGLGVMAYDKVKKKYVSVWADNFASGFMVSEGTCDASGKVITFQGESSDPMTGKTRTDKSVFRIINNDKHVFEMYGTTPDGEEFRSLEVTYTRR